MHAGSIILEEIEGNASEAITINWVISLAEGTNIDTVASRRILPICANDFGAASANITISFGAKHTSIVRLVENAILVDICADAIHDSLSNWAINRTVVLCYAGIVFELEACLAVVACCSAALEISAVIN